MNNEIPVHEAVLENDNETPVDVSLVDNEKLTDVTLVNKVFETAATMFANAQLEEKNEPLDEDLLKVFEDLEQNGFEEELYLKIKKKPAITSVEILPPIKHITMNSRKITKKQKEVDNDQNSEKHSPELVSEVMKLGEKIITMVENQKDGDKDKDEKQRPVSPPAMHKSGKHGQKIITVDDDNEEEDKLNIYLMPLTRHMSCLTADRSLNKRHSILETSPISYCRICLGDFIAAGPNKDTLNSTFIIRSTCGHSYHIECLQNSLSSSGIVKDESITLKKINKILLSYCPRCAEKNMLSTSPLSSSSATTPTLAFSTIVTSCATFTSATSSSTTSLTQANNSVVMSSLIAISQASPISLDSSNADATSYSTNEVLLSNIHNNEFDNNAAVNVDHSPVNVIDSLQSNSSIIDNSIQVSPLLVYRRSPNHLLELRRDILQRLSFVKPKDVWISYNKVNVRLKTGSPIALKDRNDVYLLPMPQQSYTLNNQSYTNHNSRNHNNLRN
ncbi:hypothetical protein HCN44_007190 [Aphidius gifuensis]|uniref:RING-type domain-containing protein n=1 Tax=Aphidius gifuensis TaxID=684658 RepID=A0A835CQ75_APHGI|nr:hypothetical protein HCN44_007190 [Aphidius gifuensis]